MSDKKNKLEAIKSDSDGLRASIEPQLRHDTSTFDEAARHVLKFHGLYQQDDRDRRAELRAEGRDKAYSFMVRSKIPGGRLTPEQYMVHDELATRYGNGSLRITTRQDFQLHGVLKGDVRRAVQGINEALLTTLGACGDVVRNVVCCPLPAQGEVRRATDGVVDAITEKFEPRTHAYHEIWLDGEKVVAPPTAEEEPFYGKAYLPRKFKIGVAYPGDNCVDVLTHDVGLVALGDGERLEGFNVLVGGGLGMTHKKPATFPRLADPLGFVEPHRIVDVVEQIVAIQRDHGDRSDRRHARLKYLIHDRGLNWFRRRLERQLGGSVAPPHGMPAFDLELHLGWNKLDDGLWCLGLSVENGRILDRDDLRLRAGLRAIVERYRPQIRLTPNQDVLLSGLSDADRTGVEIALREFALVKPERLSTVRRHSMACPALPTCGLALAEAERALPYVIDRLEQELAHMGLADERLTVRMTGCPNGCARPYVADIAFVGRSLGVYAVFVGGRSDGTRLNRLYEDLVPEAELVERLLPLLHDFREARRHGESFGDFCDRIGVEALLARAAGGRRIAGHG